MKKPSPPKIRRPPTREPITEVIERARVRHLRAAAEAAGQPIGPAEAAADESGAAHREFMRTSVADRALEVEEGKRLVFLGLFRENYLLGLVRELYNRALGFYPNVTKSELIAALRRVIPARRGPAALSPVPPEERRLLRLALDEVLREKKHEGWGRRAAIEYLAERLGTTPEGLRDLLK